jgi:hypothetical protein
MVAHEALQGRHGSARHSTTQQGTVSTLVCTATEDWLPRPEFLVHGWRQEERLGSCNGMMMRLACTIPAETNALQFWQEP